MLLFWCFFRLEKPFKYIKVSCQILISYSVLCDLWLASKVHNQESFHIFFCTLLYINNIIIHGTYINFKVYHSQHYWQVIKQQFMLQYFSLAWPYFHIVDNKLSYMGQLISSSSDFHRATNSCFSTLVLLHH